MLILNDSMYWMKEKSKSKTTSLYVKLIQVTKGITNACTRLQKKKHLLATI